MPSALNELIIFNTTLERINVWANMKYQIICDRMTFV